MTSEQRAETKHFQFEVEELNSVERFDGAEWFVVGEPSEERQLPKMSRFSAVAVPYDKTTLDCKCVPLKRSGGECTIPMPDADMLPVY